MRTVKKIIILLLSLSMVITPLTFAANENVKVYFNGDEADLFDKSAYFNSNIGIIMAPMELFSDILGLKVEYDFEVLTVVITRESIIMTFTVDENTVQINNRTISLDTPPVSADGTVYIPLRVAAVNLGYELEYISEDKRVNILTVYDYELGITTDKMKAIYGTPVRTEPSEKGYIWQVYNTNFTDYILCGLDKGRVVAYYLNSTAWKLPSGVGNGTKLATCNTIMNSLGYKSTAGTNYTTYTTDESTLTVYYDSTADKVIYAALLEYTEYAERFDITPSALTAMEKRICDLSNIYRVKNGLEPLAYNDEIAKIARSHSNDMAEKNIFSHQGTDGLDKAGRIKAAGYGDCYISEAISKAFPDCFTAFASLVVNYSYNQILTANFDSISAGFAYNPDSDGVIYCTQLFYAVKD